MPTTFIVSWLSQRLWPTLTTLTPKEKLLWKSAMEAKSIEESLPIDRASKLSSFRLVQHHWAAHVFSLRLVLVRHKKGIDPLIHTNDTTMYSNGKRRLPS